MRTTIALILLVALQVSAAQLRVTAFSRQTMVTDPAKGAKGTSLVVVDTRGRLVDGGEVEIWQCDVEGTYSQYGESRRQDEQRDRLRAALCRLDRVLRQHRTVDLDWRQRQFGDPAVQPASVCRRMSGQRSRTAPTGSRSQPGSIFSLMRR